MVEPLTELPLSIDSAQPAVIAAVAAGRRQPPILNSIDVDGLVRGELLASTARAGTLLVVQLRRGRTLPTSAVDRSAWTELVNPIYDDWVAENFTYRDGRPDDMKIGPSYMTQYWFDLQGTGRFLPASPVTRSASSSLLTRSADSFSLS